MTSQLEAPESCDDTLCPPLGDVHTKIIYSRSPKWMISWVLHLGLMAIRLFICSYQSQVVQRMQRINTGFYRLEGRWAQAAVGK